MTELRDVLIHQVTNGYVLTGTKRVIPEPDEAATFTFPPSTEYVASDEQAAATAVHNFLTDGKF